MKIKIHIYALNNWQWFWQMKMWKHVWHWKWRFIFMPWITNNDFGKWRHESMFAIQYFKYAVDCVVTILPIACLSRASCSAIVISSNAFLSLWTCSTSSSSISPSGIKWYELCGWVKVSMCMYMYTHMCVPVCVCTYVCVPLGIAECTMFNSRHVQYNNTNVLIVLAKLLLPCNKMSCKGKTGPILYL